MARQSKFDPDSARVHEVMRKDAERIRKLWAAAKAKYDGGEEEKTAPIAGLDR